MKPTLAALLSLSLCFSAVGLEKEWPFHPLRPTKQPTVKNQEWVHNGIDSFILGKLEAKGLAPAPETEKRKLIRRLNFDLIGLPPTPEEVDAFVKDADPKAYEKLVDRLLKNPGRDHNGRALVMWMAGGDVKAGATARETDEFSLRSVGESIHIRDVHATLLNLMGLDDKRLDYLQGGRLRKLTDIGGNVLKEIIA